MMQFMRALKIQIFWSMWNFRLVERVWIFISVWKIPKPRGGFLMWIVSLFLLRQVRHFWEKHCQHKLKKIYKFSNVYIVWFSSIQVLFKINMVSKILQEKSKIPTLWQRRVKKLFLYDWRWTHWQWDRKPSFKINFFMSFQIWQLVHLKEDSNQWKKFQIFTKGILTQNGTDWKKSYMNLQKALIDGEEWEIDGQKLYQELLILIPILPARCCLPNTLYYEDCSES